MSSWVVAYVLLLLLPGLVLFAWSAMEYFRSRPRTIRRQPTVSLVRSPMVPREAFDAKLMALQAQFIVAPETAIREARLLLRERRGSDAYALPVPGGNQRDEFLAIISRL